MRATFASFITIATLMFGASGAEAAQWMVDKMGNYSLIVKGQSLTMECRAPSAEDITPTPTLYYSPVCGKGCKDVASTENDSTRKATIMIDDKSFSLPIPLNEAAGILIRRATELPELFDALADAKSITIYSGQISPHYNAFEGITNSDVLNNYYQECLSGRK